jgi:hypothetical protein
MFVKLHCFILLLCNNPPILHLTDGCQHFVVLLCTSNYTYVGYCYRRFQKTYITFATLVSKVVTEGILWVRTKNSGLLT